MTAPSTDANSEALSHRAVIDTYEYDAYGNEFTVSGSTPNEMMYRGEQFDSDLSLYYLRARYYNPATGRFMSRDPADPRLLSLIGMPSDPKSLHKYLYADGDPTNPMDPTGKATYYKPGSAIGEFLTVVSDISFKLAYYTQFALPVYLRSDQGKLVIAKAIGLLAVAEYIKCRFLEVTAAVDPTATVPAICDYIDTPDTE